MEHEGIELTPNSRCIPMYTPRRISQERINSVMNQVLEATGETWMPAFFLDHSPTAKASEENNHSPKIDHFYAPVIQKQITQ
jgi:hypothetical protein